MGALYIRQIKYMFDGVTKYWWGELVVVLNANSAALVMPLIEYKLQSSGKAKQWLEHKPYAKGVSLLPQNQWQIQYFVTLITVSLLSHGVYALLEGIFLFL